jgi:hypothetical protein
MSGHYTGLRCQMYPSTKMLLKFVGDSPRVIFCFSIIILLYVGGMWRGEGVGVLYVLELSPLEVT